ncbi:MAG: alpha/beta fold hydrolase [Actinophytocola sp.]|uniref:alpha/beta fold hydrolase n=1 Tax=Actinophytocola sp. TaxID=1872138 RepID=UPI00132514BD|nr:alpha/beta hydrolase [Actinophytocola sp.]MPZ80339.1 alpha/beta fold hydrolase [Actinophytocola sp.]
MPALAANDGTKLAYHVLGEGTPVVCLPGGPMQDSDYLGDLGGLSARLRLILLDHRGTGQSATPADPGTYRCDRLVDDVEALREHLGLDRVNLLGHSGGTNLAVLYAARYPEHIDKLVLVAPSTYALGLAATADDRREVVRLREGESWFGPASAAFERINAGQATDGDRAALTPFVYGRWDAATQAHHVSGETRRNTRAAAIYGAEGAFHPEATRAALATLGAPVLLLAGEVDVNSPPRVVAELAGLFPNATLATLPGAAHFLWLDDPTWFTTTIASFLGVTRPPRRSRGADPRR